ncbi:MAG TPA: thiamine ABC transporter substrate-binding protein [Thermotogota bacterium]|nr:thiamine ABC transporter substrate-binding protein [Thermotogota bacterium]HRW93194.1 thiamine ABC transporter substrate-binding protein [Thermotogota bacterium]
MTRTKILLLFLLFPALLSLGLTVYTYESMGWIGEEMVPLFEKSTGIEVQVVKLGDGGGILSRLLLEKRNPRADVVVGLDQSLGALAVAEGLLLPLPSAFSPPAFQPGLELDPPGFLVPYDYGALAILVDPQAVPVFPRNFSDLLSFPRGLIIQDPRSSSTGQAFLLWTIAAFGEEWQRFWQDLKPAILTVTSGWSEAFAKFETGEAPMMVSYATDEAYSMHYYGSTRFHAFIPSEGAYVQIEGAAIVNGTPHVAQAVQFLEFLLSDTFQQQLPLNQWMFPARDVQLPPVFTHAIQPANILTLPPQHIRENLDTWLLQWEEIMY